MPNKTDLNFFMPSNEKEIMRRRRMAEMMAQAVPQSDPNRMVSGLVVPISPWEALAGGISKGISSYQNKKADDLEAEDNAKKQKVYVEIVDAGLYSLGWVTKIEEIKD